MPKREPEKKIDSYRNSPEKTVYFHFEKQQLLHELHGEPEFFAEPLEPDTILFSKYISFQQVVHTLIQPFSLWLAESKLIFWLFSPQRSHILNISCHPTVYIQIFRLSLSYFHFYKSTNILTVAFS